MENPHEAGDESVDVARVVDASGLQHHQRAEQTRRWSLEDDKTNLVEGSFLQELKKTWVDGIEQR